MFNLFKKKQQESEVAPKPEYVPEKPVVELFEAVKDAAFVVG